MRVGCRELLPSGSRDKAKGECHSHRSIGTESRVPLSSPHARGPIPQRESVPIVACAKARALSPNSHERRRQTPSEAPRGRGVGVDVARERLWWDRVTLEAPRRTTYRSLGAVPSSPAFREIYRQKETFRDLRGTYVMRW